MNASYRHTQFGYLTAGGLGIAAIGVAYAAVVTPGAGMVVILLAAVAAVVVFSSLTAVVREHALEVFFGPGLIRRRISLSDVSEVRAVRNPWYCGWGIRWIGNGWMWNVSGLKAVELRFRDGRRFRVGSDEPERLAAAIEAERAGARPGGPRR